LGEWSADSQGDQSGRVDELHAIEQASTLGMVPSS